MKRIIFSFLAFIISAAVLPQAKTDVLQGLETDQKSVSPGTVAKLKSSSRLFKDKDDLTSVILVIPSGSATEVVSGDSVFLKVIYEDNTGYIYLKHAEIIKQAIPAAIGSPGIDKNNDNQANMSTSRQAGISRYEYLERKYGQSLAQKIYAGKIWRGMRAEMVKDSWGSPRKISKIISSNVVKEDWYYNKTLLFFRNSTLVDWNRVRD